MATAFSHGPVAPNTMVNIGLIVQGKFIFSFIANTTCTKAHGWAIKRVARENLCTQVVINMMVSAFSFVFFLNLELDNKLN